VRTLLVVHEAPGVEATLAVDEVGERCVQHLAFGGLVEALVLAERLRVVRPAVRDRHTEPQ
jgi:hypothetical protein